MTKKIENITDFLQWAKQVNLCFSSKGMPDLQDEFARTDRKVLQDIFIGAEQNDRRLLLFGIYKAMSDDVFFDYINHVVNNKVNKIAEQLELEISNRWTEIKTEQIALDETKEQINNHMQAIINICK